MVRGIAVEAVVFICRTEKSQGIVTETMRVTSPDFLRPAFIIESNYILTALIASIQELHEIIRLPTPLH